MYKAHTNTPNADKTRTKNRSNTSQNHIVTIVTFSRGRIQASYLVICPRKEPAPWLLLLLEALKVVAVVV